jgi:hypothetical protein
VRERLSVRTRASTLITTRQSREGKMLNTPAEASVWLQAGSTNAPRPSYPDWADELSRLLHTVDGRAIMLGYPRTRVT